MPSQLKLLLSELPIGLLLGRPAVPIALGADVVLAGVQVDNPKEFLNQVHRRRSQVAL